LLSVAIRFRPRSPGAPMKRDRSGLLPSSCPPRGLARVEAAAYVGVSPSLFDAMVKDGRMPQPKVINARIVWDRHQLDLAFEALPEKEDPVQREGPANEWERMN
jgi:predicted DNA-binding transcriptional regulator AlpA